MRLKFFKLDPTRHAKVVDLKFYQMGLSSIVELMRKTEDFDQDLYPSWSKTVANPIRAKGFFTRVLQALFLGQHGIPSLNVDEQTGIIPDHRVAMMFLPGSTRVSGDERCDIGVLGMLAQVAREALPNFEVIEVSGNTTTNAEAEGKVNHAIAKAQAAHRSVLILSAGMAQRSFSVSAITELYIASDASTSASVIQKMSRALTPGSIGKVGRIFSLSFDPNHDDTFDALILQTAINFQRKKSHLSLQESMRTVLSTIDIFRCLDEGAVKFEVDTYLEQLLERNSVARYVGKTADFSKLTLDDISFLASGIANVDHLASQPITDKGKTRPKPETSKTHKVSERPMTEKEEKLAREVITTIIENIDFLFAATGKKRLSAAFAHLVQNPSLKASIEREYGVSSESIQHLFSSGVINQNVVELLA